MILNIIVIFFLLSFLLLLIHTFYVKQNYFKIKTNINLSCKILQISDLHGRRLFLNGSISKLINKHNPDIVCITGDLTSKHSQFPKIYAEIKKINCQNIFFVPGNYEREELIGFRKKRISQPQYIETIRQLKAKVHVLENENCIVKVNGLKISVYGFDNSIYGNEKYIVDTSEDNSVFKIFLAHSPSIIKFMDQHRINYDLLLVGHTHGGQIRFGNWTLGKYRNFHVGMKQNQHKYFYINRGLGTVKLPFRLNCYPEITVFDLE